MVKKTVVLLFLLLVLLQSGGMICLLKIHQYCIQYEMAAQLYSKELPNETIELSLTEYSNAAEGNGTEINWKGKLYDVISIKYKLGKLILLAHNDTREENVIAALVKFIKFDNRKQKEAPSVASYFLSLIYLQPSFHFSITPILVAEVLNSYYATISKTFHQEIASPPPKLAS